MQEFNQEDDLQKVDLNVEYPPQLNEIEDNDSNTQWEQVEWEEAPNEFSWPSEESTQESTQEDDSTELEPAENEETTQQETETSEDIIVTVPIQPDPKKASVHRWTKLEKENALKLHKIHQLCYISHGVLCSDLSDSEDVQAVALSMIPQAVQEKITPAKSYFTLLATKLLKDFQVVQTDDLITLESVLACSSKRRGCYTQLVILYVAIARMVAKLLNISPPRIAIACNPISSNPTLDDGTNASQESKQTKKKRKSDDNFSAKAKPNSNYNSNNNNNNNNSARKDYRIWAEVHLSGDWVAIQIDDTALEQYQYYFGIAPHYIVDVTRRYVPSANLPCPLQAPIPLPPLYNNAKSANIPHSILEILDHEDAILSVLAHQQMPKSLAGFKNHPTYVLKQHLHMYEAIPPSAPIIAHFKGSPVYHRSYVQTMHTAEKWLQEGRQVRDGEQPCASKKSTSKSSKSSKADASKGDGLSSDPTSADGSAPSSMLFGEWQTDLYVPPTMVNGVIPTNSFGNVYMYSPDMVPFGCVHLPYKGIQKIANKLSINSAPALVGWEYKKGRGYPMLQGIVVAQEHGALLHQVYFDELEKTQQEKIEKEEQAKMQAERQEAKRRKIEAYVDSTYNNVPQSNKENEDTHSNQPSSTSSTSSTTSKSKKGRKSNSNTTNTTSTTTVPDNHFHVFPEKYYTHDMERDIWFKKCECGYSVEFEKV